MLGENKTQTNANKCQIVPNTSIGEAARLF